MLSGPGSDNHSRKPEIVGDAVYALICKDSRSVTGQFMSDEEILKGEGINDFTDYACNPGELGMYRHSNAVSFLPGVMISFFFSLF